LAGGDRVEQQRVVEPLDLGDAFGRELGEVAWTSAAVTSRAAQDLVS